MRTSTFCYALTACALALPAQALVIDTFTDAFTSPLETDPGGSDVSSSEAGGAGFLFEERETALDSPLGAPAFSASVLEIDETSGQLGFSNEPFVTTSFFEIEYTSSSGEDLTDGGLNSIFEFDLSFSDVMTPDSGSLFVIVVDGDTDDSSVEVFFTGPATLTVAFSEFDSEVDFSDITSFRFQVALSDVDAPDLTFDEIRTAVPEPATFAAIFAAFVLGVSVLRRRVSREARD
ncbi:MAG: PEP-CTERM sorting domain-containing protein [Opitutales bacterium]